MARQLLLELSDLVTDSPYELQNDYQDGDKMTYELLKVTILGYQ